MGFQAFMRTIINQPLCQIFLARSIKNCMTSMQLCRDHPCREIVPWSAKADQGKVLSGSISRIVQNTLVNICTNFGALCKFEQLICYAAVLK